jgi:hypothetical protein
MSRKKLGYARRKFCTGLAETRSLSDGLAGIVPERLGNELAVGVEILHALGGNGDFDVVDVVFLLGLACYERVGNKPARRIFHASPGLFVRRNNRISCAAV